MRPQQWILLLTMLLYAYGVKAIPMIQDTTAAAMAFGAKHYASQVLRLEEALKADKENTELLIALARAHWELGENKKAQKYMEKAIDQKPQDARDYYLLGRIYSSRVNEVSIFKKLSYAGKIRDSFQRTIELNPGHVKAHLALLLFYLNAPGIAGGGRDKAEEIIVRLRRINDTAAWRGELLLALADGELEQAYDYLDKILNQIPNDVDSLFTRSILFINEEKYESAIQDLRHLVTLDVPDEYQRHRQLTAWYQLGKLASESGEWLAEGRQYLEAYIALDLRRDGPGKAWAYYRLAGIYGHMNENERRVEYLTLAQDTNDGDDDDLEDLLREEFKALKG